MSQAVNAQYQAEANKGEIINQLKALREKISKYKTVNSNSVNTQGKCRTLINDAILNMESRDSKFPKAYLVSLQSLTNIADNIKNETESSKDNLLKLIYRDLLLKFSFNQQTIGNADFVKLVPVSVIVYRQGFAVNYLRVNYCVLAHMNAKRNPDSQFLQLTSPAIDQLVPGIYQLWLTKDGDPKILREIEVEVDPSKANHNIEFYLQ